MENLFAYLPYVFVGIAIFVFIFKVKKMVPGGLENLKKLKDLNPQKIAAQYENKMPQLASLLGLKYEDLSSNDPSDKKQLFDNRCKITGTYRDTEILISMGGTARQHDAVPLGYSYGYSYKIEKLIVLSVNNTNDKSFQILPKRPHIIAEDTGVKAFDNILTLTSNIEIPEEYLEYFVSLAWMNLKLDKNRLVFEDTFYEDLLEKEGALNGSAQMMIARHPIWGSSAQAPNIDINRVQEFIDKLIDLTSKLNIK